MQFKIDTKVKLNNGVGIPIFGLGVFRAGAGEGTRNAVGWALDAGYRHIDTAHIYGNEVEVGAALQESRLHREKVFVTTKLWNDHQGYRRTLKAIDKSLTFLKLDYVDLFLMHWPEPGERLESWRAMEEIYAEGKARAIGVSNFMRRHLDELVNISQVVPAVNQIELHPFCQQRDAVARSRELGIAVQAYSPLAKAKRMDHPVLVQIANATGRSVAQVMIRWGLQHGFIQIPKSADRDRIRENATVFDFALTPDQMKQLDALEEGFHSAWDPTNVP